MKKIFQALLGPLKHIPDAFRQLGRWHLLALSAVCGVLLLATVYGLLATMQTHPPRTDIDQQLLRERLFISVCTDSLEQLAASRGLFYDGPGFFSRRAAIGLPAADQPLLSELDSLQAHYPDELEIEDGLLYCRTEKMGGTRYVNMPVVLLLRMYFLKPTLVDPQP